MQCKLCLVKEADQTGSHILTSSLIAHCINQDGKKGRDKEIMYSIGQDGSADVFVGRDVLKEKFEEVTGKNVDEYDLNLNKNEVVVDYIFCKDCEKLFGYVETKFSPELNKIRTTSKELITDGALLRLYFLIQVFRASVVRYNDWFLDYPFEKELRGLVYSACQAVKYSTKIDDKINQIPVLITYLETVQEERSSNHIVIPNFNSPTVFFLCDFVVQIFQNFTNSIPKRLIEIYNLNDKRKPEDFIQNQESFKIFRFKNGERKCLNDNLTRLDLAPQFCKTYQLKFLILCGGLGRIPTKHRMSHFFQLLLNESVPLDERYSKNRIIAIAKYVTQF